MQSPVTSAIMLDAAPGAKTPEQRFAMMPNAPLHGLPASGRFPTAG